MSVWPFAGMYIHMYMYIDTHIARANLADDSNGLKWHAQYIHMGWLRLAGSLKL